MFKKYLKPLLSLSVIGITIAVFIYYFIHHPEIKTQLSRLSVIEVVILLLIYALSIVALALVNSATLKVCNIKPITSEAILLTAYSAVINFFGPLQSGPAARAVYLKKKYNLNLKKYGMATLIYYFFWAFYSGLFLLSGILKWYLLPLALLGLIVLYFFLKQGFVKDKVKDLNLKNWYLIAVATFLQILCVVIIYYIELHSVNPTTKLSQAIIYTGAASFALFVSITPGAIGFRETFLVFSKHLHHISNSVIVSANIIDRSVYIIFLLILAVVILCTHASNRLNLKKVSN